MKKDTPRPSFAHGRFLSRGEDHSVHRGHLIANRSDLALPHKLNDRLNVWPRHGMLKSVSSPIPPSTLLKIPMGRCKRFNGAKDPCSMQQLSFIWPMRNRKIVKLIRKTGSLTRDQKTCRPSLSLSRETCNLSSQRVFRPRSNIHDISFLSSFLRSTVACVDMFDIFASTVCMIPIGSD